MTEETYNKRKGVRRSDLWKLNRSPAHFKYAQEHPVEQTAADIHELSAFLKTRKGFSAVRVGRSQRLFYATALVAIDALLGMPADAPDAAKKRDLLQTLMVSGILLFIAASMAASGI